MAKRIDWGSLAGKRLTGATWKEQVLETNKSGFDNGNRKERQVGNRQNNPEKKKTKNQPEIEGVRENNESIRRERAEIGKAVEDSLSLVEAALERPNLSETDRVRLERIKKSVKEAKNKSLNGESYVVEILGSDGKVAARRSEGLPVDELVAFVADLKQRTRAQVREIHRAEQNLKDSRTIKDKYEIKIARAGINGEEYKKKLVWYEVLSGLPAIDVFRVGADEEVKKWEEADRKKAEEEGKTFSGYDAEHKKQQLGEALRQLVEKYLNQDSKKLREALESRTKRLGKYHNLAKKLLDGSLPYFAFHYPENYKSIKNTRSLNEAQKKEQHLYTEQEVNLIAQDVNYRQFLLDKFAAKLPANFRNMDAKQQNYRLAVLALENRRVLVLPKEQSIPKEDAVEEEKTTPQPVSTLPPNAPQLSPKYKLENTNPPEDLENIAMSLPEIPKVPDKKLFLIDISEIAKRMAWTKAEEKLRQQFDHKGGFFGRVVKNAWKGLSENHYRLKFYQEAIKEIETDNNLMCAISERVSGQTMPGGGSRISSEYLELLNKVVAEYKNEVMDAQREVGDSMNNNPEVQDRIAELLYRYRANKWDGAAYKGLDKRAAVELFVKENIVRYINKQSSAKWTTDTDRLKEAKGLLYASNFYEIIESIDKNYKEQIDAAVKEVMDKNPKANIEIIRDAISKQVEGVKGLNLQLGLKDRDIVNNRPKGILSLYEKAVDWGESHKVLGRIVLNPFVMGAAATVTAQGVQRAIKWAAVGGAVAAGASGFWVPLGVGAAAGGLYRAFKRGKDVKYDIAQELRHKTLGGKPSEILAKGRDYGAAVMSFAEANAQIAAVSGKKEFSDSEKQQLAKIYARLQLERDLIKETSKNFTKLDLFELEENEGKRYGSTAAAKSDLRVAIKNIGISEQALQGMIDLEKANILKLIEATNKQQESFRKKEMVKSFFGGAIMGFAGGVLAQEAIHLGGEQLEKLWGGSYFKNQHTSFEKIVDWAKGSQMYQSHFGHGAMAGGAVEHIITGSRAQTSMEWLRGLKGNVAGGDVETIHTQNWYDNPTGEAPHIHNANELKFYISKDSAGNFHFKVPVEQDGSWKAGSGWADLDKAFSEDRIKMLFVPDGSSPHEAIVLDVDPTTHEVIIPKDSNIANLFDAATGRPKGTGFFGLAEQVGARGDGSKNYIWISSDRNSGQNIDFGKVNITQKFIPDKPIAAPVEYDQAIATVPPQRKVFYRPGENLKEEKKKQKIAEKEAKKKAQKEKKTKEKEEKAKTKKQKDEGHGGGGVHETGGGGGSASHKEQNKASGEKELKVPEFSGDILKRYLNPKYAAELLKIYAEQNGAADKINKRAIKYAIEGNKHKGVLRIDKPVKKDIAKAVWEMEQVLIKGKILSQDQADEFYSELGEIEAGQREAAKVVADKSASEVSAKPAKEEVQAATLNANKSVAESGKSSFGRVSEEFLEKTGHRVHFIMEGELMPDQDKLKVLKTFDLALDQLSGDVKNVLLTKFNSAHKGTKLSKGVLLSFDANISKVGFGKDNGLRIPPNAGVEEVKTFLETACKQMLERRTARLGRKSGNPREVSDKNTVAKKKAA